MLEELLLRRLAPARCVAFLGLAKNTGKTTALNFVAALLHKNGKRLGLVTSGRDGETTDLLYGTPKPPVRALRGQRLVTTEDEAGRSSAGLAGLSQSLAWTSLGPLRLYEVTRPGEVVLVGPATCDELAPIVERLLDDGCDRVLVDGAVNRKAFVRPGLADGVVAATGAALDADLDRLVEKTAEALAPFRLPQDGNGGLAVEGSFSDEKAEALLKDGFRGTVVAADPSKVFVAALTHRRLAAAGIRLAVRETVPILALTVNPTSPNGARLDSEILMQRLQTLFPDLPTVDLLTCRLQYHPS